MINKSNQTKFKTRPKIAKPKLTPKQEANQMAVKYLASNAGRPISAKTYGKMMRNMISQKQAYRLWKNHFIATSYYNPADGTPGVDTKYFVGPAPALPIMKGSQLIKIKWTHGTPEIKSKIEEANGKKDFLYNMNELILNQTVNPLTGMDILRIINDESRTSEFYKPVDLLKVEKDYAEKRANYRPVEPLTEEVVNNINRDVTNYLMKHSNNLIDLNKMNNALFDEQSSIISKKFYHAHFIAKRYRHHDQPGIDTEYVGKHLPKTVSVALPIMNGPAILKLKDKYLKLPLEEYKKLVLQNKNHLRLYNVNDMIVNHRVVPLTGEDFQDIIDQYPEVTVSMHKK